VLERDPGIAQMMSSS